VIRLLFIAGKHWGWQVKWKLLVFALVVCAQPALAEETLAEGDSGYPVLHMAGSTHSAEQIRHGEYLVKMADCFTCHTNEAEHGKVFAGGLKIQTPFGALYAPNITPDKATGIGNWSDEDFVMAVREGIAPDGSYYYPVFPYNYFNRMSRQDVLDIKAYLDVIPAVRQQNHPQEMNWPFNYRILQAGWRLLFFDFNKGAFKPAPGRSKLRNRGTFIVEGPGHCALCHTRLNYFGVPEQAHYLAGAFVEGYYAPNITSQGLRHLANSEVANIFLHNETPTHAELGGPMRGVEHNSLRYLSQHDMLAIAECLKSVRSQPPAVEVNTGRQFSMQDGKKLYESSCAMCHANQLMGAPGTDKHVWDVLLDQGREKLYEVAIRGSGDMPAKGGCDECANGRVKSAVDYMIDLAEKK
jgi:cytochrome c5